MQRHCSPRPFIKSIDQIDIPAPDGLETARPGAFVAVGGLTPDQHRNGVACDAAFQRALS